MKRSCFKTFHEAAERRTAYPLSSGCYKLKDAQRSLKKIEDNTEQATRFVLSEPGPKEFRSKEQSHDWMKSVPERMAEVLGHDIVPAIDALTGDGIPTESVDGLREFYIPHFASLLDGIQYAQRRMNLRREYRKDRQTLLRTVLNDLIILTNALLRDAQRLIPIRSTPERDFLASMR